MQSILHARDAKDETFIVVSQRHGFRGVTCDRPAPMRNGTIIDVGTTGEILAQVAPRKER